MSPASLRHAPQFRASPAPTEEEAAVIAVALMHLLESEAGSARPLPISEGGLDPWVAQGRARRAAGFMASGLRSALPPGHAWRAAGS